MDHTVVRTSAVDAAAMCIVNYIQKNHMEVGDRLPSERELALAFKVSRTSLREAVKGLIYAGVLESIQGKGTFIRSYPQYFRDYKQDVNYFVYQSAKDQYLACVEARYIIEPNAAAIAAEKITVPELEKLKVILDRMAQNIQDNKLGACGVDDMDFHAAYIKITNNFVLYRAMQEIWNALPDYYMSFKRVPNLARESYEQHVEIYRAFEEHNAELARKRMEEHVKYYAAQNGRFYEHK